MNILLVSAALGLLLLALHRLPLSPEASRKGLHLGMGSLCLTFPWVFDSATEVDFLAGISIGALLMVRWFKPSFGGVLHRISRLSFGELLFPVGVAFVFRLSGGQAALFLPPIAILTFADTAGALVGKRFGRHPYRTKAGQKSVEGSLAVFLTSFLHLVVTFRYRELITLEHSADTISVVAVPALVWVVLKATASLAPESAFHAFNLTIMAQTAFLHSATCAHLRLPPHLFLGALKIALVASPLALWWPAAPAVVILTASIPFTSSLKRPEQALLAFLFSLLALPGTAWVRNKSSRSERTTMISIGALCPGSRLPGGRFPLKSFAYS